MRTPKAAAASSFRRALRCTGARIAAATLVAAVLLPASATGSDVRSSAPPTGDLQSSALDGNWSSPTGLGTGQWFRSLATSGTTVHVAYGDGTVRYRRSADEGSTWSSEVSLGSGNLYYDRPIFANGSNVYVVYFRNFKTVTDWCCSRELGDLFFRRSVDAGVTWLPEVQLTSAQGAYRVSLISSGANVYLAWMDYRSGTTWDLYWRRSTDEGVTWQAELKMIAGTNSVGAERPDIAVNGNSVHLFWMTAVDNLPACYTMPNCSEVYYKRSLDGGDTWGPDTRLSLTDRYSARPIATIVSPGTVLVTWEGEDGTGENEVYVLRSIDNGASWGPVERMTFISGDAGHSWLTSGGSQVHLAWFDDRTGRKQVYYRMSEDAGSTWGPEENVSNVPAPGESSPPVIETTVNFVHALWGDDRLGSFRHWYSRRATAPSLPEVHALLLPVIGVLIALASVSRIVGGNAADRRRASLNALRRRMRTAQRPALAGAMVGDHRGPAIHPGQLGRRTASAQQAPNSP